jgi:hypothetical protein
MLYLRAQMNYCAYFQYFLTAWQKLYAGDSHLTPLSTYDFCENRSFEIHTIREDLNEKFPGSTFLLPILNTKIIGVAVSCART